MHNVQQKMHPVMSVTVLQPSIDQYKKWDTAYEKEILSEFEKLIGDAVLSPAQLIIWPETAVPGFIPGDPYLYRWVIDIVRRTKVYHLIGAPYNNSSQNYFNADLLFDPNGGVVGVHEKRHLVPFGEYVPFRRILTPFFGILNTMGDFSHGKDYNLLKVGNIFIGPTICSENFFGRIARMFTLKGAMILVNQTNDAWFFKSAAAEQHFIMNVFRAIETRRGIVVCGNSGVSGVVDPVGLITHKTAIFMKLHFNSMVTSTSIMTVYSRYGDVFAQLCCLISIVLLLFFRRGKNV
jgi:apolipoprotein N-acyltransferase